MAQKERIVFQVDTPPKFNSSPLKNDGWKTNYFPFGFRPIFRGELLNFQVDTLPETSIAHEKTGHPKRKPVFQPSIFRGKSMLVSGRVPFFLPKFLVPFKIHRNRFNVGDNSFCAPIQRGGIGSHHW